ncbi:MAG: hypothetical protein PHD48_04375 [Alphaproteobacteria bacterium]|nr:hypothetical protein [Alphaproteobacteria bacterium]
MLIRIIRFCLLTCLLMCLLTLGNGAAQARAPSLFFTQEERLRIDEEVRKNPPDAAVRAKHLLHLSTILFFGTDDWSIWLQGEKWTPATDKPDIHILAVTPDEVHLSVKLHSGRIIEHVLLRPHQSLNLLNGQVIEGF